MAGFFDTLMGLGTAHQQHVQAVTAAFHNPDMQAARDQLAAYLQGLNELQLLGFRTSLGILASNEGNPQVQQGLQWIAENMEGLRAGPGRAMVHAKRGALGQDRLHQPGPSGGGVGAGNLQGPADRGDGRGLRAVRGAGGRGGAGLGRGQAAGLHLGQGGGMTDPIPPEVLLLVGASVVT